MTGFLLTAKQKLMLCINKRLYWAYRMGGLLDAALAKRSMPTQNRSVVYLILAVIQLGFVGWILMQNTINSMIPDAV